MGRMQGKQVLLTAAGQGIGRASALMLAREGAKVIATDINEELLDDLANTAKEENLDITVRKVDVTCKSDILTLAEALEKVDVLFNCAGLVVYFLRLYILSLMFSDMSIREVSLTALMIFLKRA